MSEPLTKDNVLAFIEKMGELMEQLKEDEATRPKVERYILFGNYTPPPRSKRRRIQAKWAKKAMRSTGFAIYIDGVLQT